MKKCPYCAEKIQDDAIVCRFCGREINHEVNKKQTIQKSNISNFGRGILITMTILVIMIAILAIIGKMMGNNNGGSKGKDDLPDEYSGYSVCKQFVEDQLKAPKTADFPTLSETKHSLEGAFFTTTAFVDSENSFGAMIRTKYFCKVEYNGHNKWRLVDLKVIE